jgi:hypothetical protein
VRTRRKRWLILTLGLALAVLGAAIWRAPSSGYSTFTTRSLGPENTALRIVLPATWSAESSPELPKTTSGSRMVYVFPRSPNFFGAWIDSYLRQSKPNPKQQPVIFIALEPHQAVIDLDAESRNFKMTTLKNAAGSGVLRTSCKIGTVLYRDFTNNRMVPPMTVRLIRIYRIGKSPAQHYEIEMTCITGRDAKDSTFHTCDDVVSRLQLVDDTTGRASR